MGGWFWFWLVVAVILFFGLFPTLGMSAAIYSVLLVRTKPEKWGRECSMPEDEECSRMFDIGMKWHDENAAVAKDVDVVSDGLHLYGEYFDFGSDSCVIIIPGRMESMLYSYYYAEPYKKAGCNVLVIDNRAHGLSEGKYCSLGFREYRDILEWGRLLNEKFTIKKVYLHGICIGASVAIFTLTSGKCPDYFAGMIADGMYTRFYDSFRRHMESDHRPLFPFLWEVMFYLWLCAGAHAISDGPARRIASLDRPILFIHSRLDTFSLPEKAQMMYDECKCAKQLVWFDKGGHSKVRINNPEKYDDAIGSFIKNCR